MIAVGLCIVFYMAAVFPGQVEDYFKEEYYNQFGPIAICIELFIAGLYLFLGSPKANFALALFSFTALMDPIFDFANVFDSLVPPYAMVLFILCALPALWVAFTNAFNSGRITLIAVLGSFALGCAVDLFFNSVL